MSQTIHSVTLSLPLPLLLSPFCLLSAAEGKPKGNDHPQGLLSSRKTKVARAKNAFSPAVPSPMAGPWAGIRDWIWCQPGNVFKMQKENILAVLPSAQAFPLGNLLPCRMYKKRIFWGGRGCVWVCSLVKAQVSVLSTLWENSHGPPWLLWERRNVNQKLNSPNFVGGLPCYAEYLCVHSCLPWLWEKALYLYGNKLVSQSVYVPEHYIIFPDRLNETN